MPGMAIAVRVSICWGRGDLQGLPLVGQEFCQSADGIRGDAGGHGPQVGECPPRNGGRDVSVERAEREKKFRWLTGHQQPWMLRTSLEEAKDREGVARKRRVG